MAKCVAHLRKYFSNGHGRYSLQVSANSQVTRRLMIYTCFLPVETHTKLNCKRRTGNMGNKICTRALVTEQRMKEQKTQEET